MDQTHAGRDEDDRAAPDGTMAWAHGMFEYRCERCVLVDQLDHARTVAAGIPAKEARLLELDEAAPGHAGDAMSHYDRAGCDVIGCVDCANERKRRDAMSEPVQRRTKHALGIALVKLTERAEAAEARAAAAEQALEAYRQHMRDCGECMDCLIETRGALP